MNPFVIVIFGATGDLAKRKLFPALFSLYKEGLLGGKDNKMYIVGFARRLFSDEEYADMIGEALELNGNKDWEAFAKNIYYQQGFFDEVAGYDGLIDKLNTFDEEIGACITRLFYLATPPDNYASILHHLSTTKLSEGCGQGSEKWTRLAIEKPFGKDLDTARQLDKTLGEIFEERQIYRVDHYLGKETVQNMIAFRFANSIFEPIWNNKYIDHVQITWAETATVSRRGNFFDGVGMLRDVMQNHLMQIMATVTMEQPRSFTKEDVREQRAKAIKSIRLFDSASVRENVVRAQYEGYRDETGVAKDSRTDTYVAMKLCVDTPRFADVPFYLRAGKAMEKNLVDIKIVFRQTCHLLFKEYGCPEVGNVLTIKIQPDEGIGIRVITKQPWQQRHEEKLPDLATVDMSFDYEQSFGGHGLDAYGRVLLDILRGDQMLFNRSDELESSWGLMSSILQGWENDPDELPIYPVGSSGPGAAEALIVKDGKKWL